MIYVRDFFDIAELHEASELEKRLLKRDKQGRNSLWLSFKPDGFPRLLVMTLANVSALIFNRTEDDPGFISQGASIPEGFTQNGSTTFVPILGTEDIDTLNVSLVSSSKALQAALEFFAQGRLPECLDWLEL